MGTALVKESIRLLPLLAFMALLAGCATSPPTVLRDAPENSPSLNQLRTQPDSYAEVRLSWGGTIARVENLPQTTRIEVVARKLYSTGEPIESDHSEGRFIAQFDQFLDPAIYSAGRAVTVIGRFTRMEHRQLDQMQYRYPLISVESHYLWPVPEPVEPYYDPYWHDPLFYDPLYPFGYPFGYPYYYPYPHRPHHH